MRAILNLGHTLAHALESYFNYSKVKHGEAVALGLSFSVFFSVQKSLMKKKDFENTLELLSKINLPFHTDSFCKATKIKKQDMPNPDELIYYMKKDKKSYRGSLRFVFLQRIGKAKLPQEIDEKEIKNALNKFFKL